MRKFSFDVPSSSKAVFQNESNALLVQETKVLRFESGDVVDTRKIQFIEFCPEVSTPFFKERPTGNVLVTVWSAYLQEHEGLTKLSLQPEEAKKLYQTLFDEFFDDAGLEDVKMAIRMNSFPLRWSKDLDWQPFQIEREVKETVEKNW